MTCLHKRLKSVNCVIICADCGARIETPQPAETEEERVTSASGRKIGFNADGVKKPAPRRRKKTA